MDGWEVGVGWLKKEVCMFHVNHKNDSMCCMPINLSVSLYILDVCIAQGEMNCDKFHGIWKFHNLAAMLAPTICSPMKWLMFAILSGFMGNTQNTIK